VRILRSVAAIVAGYGFMALTVMIGIIVATALFVPAGMPAEERGAASPALPVAYLAANLGISLLGAVLGGWLTARIAAFAPFGHAAALAAIVATLTILTAATAPAGPQPAWYPIVIGSLGVIGVLAGGMLRAAAAAAGAAVVA
jgi:hypothetical protein